MNRTHKWSLIAAATLCVFAVIAIGAGAALFVGPLRFGEDTDSPTKVQIESFGRFKFPASARDVTAHLEGFQDHTLWVRFRMTPSDEPRFWSSSQCSAVPSEDSGPHELGPLARPWWTPEKSNRFAYRKFTSPTGDTQIILIDEDDPADFTVYVEAFDI